VGADAKTLEQAVPRRSSNRSTGVDNMDYMYSLTPRANSQTTLSANFDLKTDPNIDLILSNHREQLAAAQLSARSQQIWVTIKSQRPRRSCWSPYRTARQSRRKFSPTMATSTLTCPLARLYGIAQTTVFGAGDYAMRLCQA